MENMGTSGAIIFKYKGIYIVMYNQFASYPSYPGLGYDLCDQVANMLEKYGNDKWLEWKKRMKYILILYNKGEKYIVNYHLTINNPSTYPVNIPFDVINIIHDYAKIQCFNDDLEIKFESRRYIEWNIENRLKQIQYSLKLDRTDIANKPKVEKILTPVDKWRVKTYLLGAKYEQSLENTVCLTYEKYLQEIDRYYSFHTSLKTTYYDGKSKYIEKVYYNQDFEYTIDFDNNTFYCYDKAQQCVKINTCNINIFKNCNKLFIKCGLIENGSQEEEEEFEEQDIDVIKSKNVVLTDDTRDKTQATHTRTKGKKRAADYDDETCNNPTKKRKSSSKNQL